MEMTEQKPKIYENVLTVKELHDTLSKMIEQGYGDAPVFSKDPEHPRTFNAVYGWGNVYFHEHNYKRFYLILGIDDEIEQMYLEETEKKE
jgi:hypothetical protein